MVSDDDGEFVDQPQFRPCSAGDSKRHGGSDCSSIEGLVGDPEQPVNVNLSGSSGHLIYTIRTTAKDHLLTLGQFWGTDNVYLEYPVDAIRLEMSNHELHQGHAYCELFTI